MRTFFALLFTLVTLPLQAAPFDYSFDSALNRWTLSNGVAAATFELTQTGQFRMIQAGLAGQAWQAPAGGMSSPIRFALDGRVFDSSTQYVLIEQHTETTSRKGMRQVILLRDLSQTTQVQLNIDLFPNQPVVRFRSVVTNLGANSVYVTSADMLPLTFSDDGGPFRAFTVNQWAVVPRDLDFSTTQVTLNGSGDPLNIFSGAHGTRVSWATVRDPKNRGMFAGWEFNGRSAATVRDTGAKQMLAFSVPIDDLHHPLPGGASFYIPAGFIGFYQGDWDEAGYRTQRFVETSLAKPAPDLQRFPYMSWDSWAFQEQFDEGILRRNAALAAQLGVELFIVDLGWAKQIGDWHADPAKFPNGLKALSDYVHALGMKFGLHLTPAEAMRNSPILTANPDWTSTEDDNYFGAASLCLSHQPVKNWVVNEIVRVIDEYAVDWILQDGENMVKSCSKETHTHDSQDSNYANSVEGIDYVVEEVLRQRPNTSWENCEDGGNMMTFKMVQNYVTSIANDASGALGSRQGAFGATYPFSPRFVDRYSPEAPVTPYNTQSYMFGGPWHMMSELDAMTPDGLSFAAGEIAAYKSMRGSIRDGKVYHLTTAPAVGRIDAIESSYLGRSLIAIVTREGGDADAFTLKLKGAAAAGVYSVRFQNDARTFTMTGLQLANDGVLVSLPDAQSSEIVFADRH